MSLENSILPKFVVFNILLITFISLLSCDIQFGSGSSGGGGGGGDSFETLTGTVTMITPSTIPVEGSFVVINDNLDLSATLSSSGFFMIQGLFSGNPLVDFREQENSSPFAETFVTVYRGATVELGTITIENGRVNLPDPTVTNFNGTVIQNNCTENSGTLQVQTRNTNPKVFVSVNISPTTDITGCRNQSCFCEDIGTKVKVRGILQSANVVNAGTLTIQ
jgi:hypothetical protein